MSAVHWLAFLAAQCVLLAIIAVIRVQRLEREPQPTLRDYFAGKAVQGICAHHDTWGELPAGIAARAYEVADEMLKARSA